MDRRISELAELFSAQETGRRSILGDLVEVRESIGLSPQDRNYSNGAVYTPEDQRKLIEGYNERSLKTGWKQLSVDKVSSSYERRNICKTVQREI